MKNLRVAARYAKSLLDLAQDQNKLDVIKGDVDNLQEMLGNRDFYLLMKSPIVSPAKKKSILESIFSAAKLDEMTTAFARILITKGRESNLPEIVSAFQQQYKSLKNITSVQITSATPLTEVEMHDIRAKLLASEATGQEVDIETTIDESLIGGFVLEYNGKVYDGSVAHKLKEIRKEFSKPNIYVSQIDQS
ncbi:ATP synthase F1 subunit delta [Lewinellaceae bacterium SD302]|nr:ATP synthase F1 subunit delta [Lewinellaceae bacterium SD302]